MDAACKHITLLPWLAQVISLVLHGRTHNLLHLAIADTAGADCLIGVALQDWYSFCRFAMLSQLGHIAQLVLRCIAGPVLLLQLCPADSAGHVPAICFKGSPPPTQHSIHHQACGRSPHKCSAHCNAYSHCVLALLLCYQAATPRNPCASTREGQAGSRCGGGCL